MIIVAGCSWACGEWSRGDKLRGIVHEGLSLYIAEQKKPCLNLGIPGGSNMQVAQKIQGWLDRNPDANLDKILIFQTEYTRDLEMKFEEDFDDVSEFDFIPGTIIARFYSRCVEISQIARCPVYLIGGVSDTIMLTDFEQQYPGVKVVCQSLVNLLVNGCETIDNPVLSWYSRSAIEMLHHVKKRLSPDQLQIFLLRIDQGLQRENLVFGKPKYFWPDGCHVNRVGYKILFDFLCDKGIL